MYVRPESRRRREISIPENYSGNAFNEIIEEPVPEVLTNQEEQQEPESTPAAQDTEECVQAHAPKSFLPFNIGSEELIVLGIILLLFRDGDSDDIIPLLLAILFLA